MYWNLLKPQTGSPEEMARLNNDPDIVKTPISSVFLASVFTLLSEELGLRRSADTNESKLGDGSPVPMMSYALIEYLNGLDLKGFDVLEIGGGLSTDFWAARAKSVTTLETDPAWVKQTAERNPKAVVEHVAGPLPDRIAAFDRKFGIVVIDPSANRLACARAALPKLEKGGFVILDNSDWYPNTSKLLREADLIEVDFHDFRPCHHFRATASIYMTRDFRPKPKGPRLPLSPIGGKQIALNGWDIER
jgi:predicted O-methyltransferase YrrM